jgi:hypothetical protein
MTRDLARDHRLDLFAFPGGLPALEFARDKEHRAACVFAEELAHFDVFFVGSSSAKDVEVSRAHRALMEENNMDISKIKVGQYVDVASGIWDGGQGKVVKVTAEGVEVLMKGKIKHFDFNGRSYLPKSDPRYNPNVRPDSPLRCDGTIECGPWLIEDYYSLPSGRAAFETETPKQVKEPTAQLEIIYPPQPQPQNELMDEKSGVRMYDPLGEETK